MSAEV